VVTQRERLSKREEAVVSLSSEITPREVHQLASPRVASPSRLIEVARLYERLAVRVENEWETVPPDVRELLTAFAYNTVRRRSVWEKLRSNWHQLKLAYTLLRGQEEIHIVSEYVESRRHLVDAILLAIEEEDESYQERLTAVVERAASKQEDAKL